MIAQFAYKEWNYYISFYKEKILFKKLIQCH